MFYTDRIKNLTAISPQLSRVWIRTGNPKMPLKSVWINEFALHELSSGNGVLRYDSETAELAEDHLLLAA